MYVISTAPVAVSHHPTLNISSAVPVSVCNMWLDKIMGQRYVLHIDAFISVHVGWLHFWWQSEFCSLIRMRASQPKITRLYTRRNRVMVNNHWHPSDLRKRRCDTCSCWSAADLQTTVATKHDVTARTSMNHVLAVVHTERNARTTPQSETQQTKRHLAISYC